MRKRLTAQSKLLISLLEDLNDARFCVLHSHEELPENISSDVDVIGTPAAHKLFKKALRKYRVINFERYEAGSESYVLCASSPPKPAFLRFDFSQDYRYKGRIFFRGYELLKQVTFSKKGIPILSPPAEFSYYIIKKIIKIELQQKQTDRLSRLYSLAPSESVNYLRRFLPKRSVQLIALAAETGNWSKVRKELPRIRREMLWKTAVVRPLDVLKYYAADFARKTYRVMYPTGLAVAFIGIDGSGKSTVIERTREDLTPAFRCSERYHLFPIPGRKGDAETVTNPHAKPLRGSLASLAKLIYWFVNYWIGWAIYISPRKIRSNVIFFDRYYHDLLADPMRYRYGGPMWLARLVGMFVPRPDLFILLDLPAEVALARKHEVPMEEARRLRERYLKLARSLPNAYLVDASKPLEEVVAEVEQIILEHMSVRTAQRLGLKQ